MGNCRRDRIRSAGYDSFPFVRSPEHELPKFLTLTFIHTLFENSANFENFVAKRAITPFNPMFLIRFNNSSFHLKRVSIFLTNCFPKSSAADLLYLEKDLEPANAVCF